MNDEFQSAVRFINGQNFVIVNRLPADMRDA
jgi:hypothetical protein